MNEFLKSNIWIFAFALCLATFLGYRAIETKECVEINLDNGLIKAWDCGSTSK